MSELDKYSRHDPLAKHSSRPKKAKLTVTDTDAWLKKNMVTAWTDLKKPKRLAWEISGRNTAKSVP